MGVKVIAKKGVSVFLALALIMSTGTPVSVLADEASGDITEVSVAEVLLQEEAETEDIVQTETERDERAALPADLNEIVTVENGVINLNGASVVVVPAEVQSNRYQIYPDYDGNKLPDNQIPLKIDEDTYYQLKNYELRGYSDPTKPFEGDISITVSAGVIKGVYGVYGTKEAPVCVNGDVKLYMEGGNVSGYKAIAVYYGKAKNVTFSFTKTLNDNTEMYAACESEIEGNVDFIFGGQAQLRGTSNATHAMIGVAKNSAIGGDVNAEIGFESSSDGFQSQSFRYYYTDFLGITDTKVTGSLNYDLNGIWTPGTSVFVQGGTIGKDVNIRAASTNFSVMTGANHAILVKDSIVNGNLNFSGDAQTGLTSGGGISLLMGSSAEKKSMVKGDLYVDIPNENIKNGWTGVGDYAVVEGAVYSNVAGDITIDTVGSTAYIIEENVDGKELVILEDANVLIAEGVSVELSRDLDIRNGAKLVNEGTLSLTLADRSSADGTVAGLLENKGSLTTKYRSGEIREHLIIAATGWIVNDKDATWNVGCYIDNQGKIVNYGTFVQAYSYESGVEYYYAKLGEFFTTRPLTLSHSINTGMYTHIYDSANKIYNSKMYYAIDVDYPAHCAAPPTLTGTEIVSSGISGDTNQYIRMARVGEGVTSDFTLIPGEVKVEDCVLESVTYGTKDTQIEATETSGGKVYTASVLGEFSPITITLDYGEAGKITPITLDKTSDLVAGLVVDQTYTQKAPLYDLTDLTIIGDIISEEGNVVYTHTSGKLPKGIVFKDGKLYGTFEEASDEETVLIFTVTGRNLTTAEFVLTLGAVEKALPVYEEMLSEVESLCDTQLEDILLPEADGGKYRWAGELSVKPKDQEQYAVIYLPDDITNYDWTVIRGWDSERSGVVFSVRIKVVHAWDEGKIALQPTKEAMGEKIYTCGLCGETRTEILAKIPDDSGKGDDNTIEDDNTGGNNTGSNNNTGNSTGNNIADGDSEIGQEPAQPNVGYIFNNKKSKAVYKVSVVAKEVTYVKPLKKTYTKVKIPNTVKYDGVTYKVTSIANNAFKNNKKLKSVTIPTNIKTIGNSAFYKCTALKSVTIPKNVSKIGSKAFYGCKKLTKMTIKTSKLTEKKVGKKAFTKMGSSNYKKVKVKVPKKKLKSYKKMLQKRGLSKKAKVKK